MRWFPWPSGPGGGSHVSGPELEPGLLPQADAVSASRRPGVQGAGTSPPWNVPALRWGDTGRLDWGCACHSALARESKDPQEDEIPICSYRRFPSSCYSKTKCFTHLRSIIKYRPAGWSVVGANFLQFAERLVIRPFKKTCQNCFDCANATCKHSAGSPGLWLCTGNVQCSFL